MASAYASGIDLVGPSNPGGVIRGPAAVSAVIGPDGNVVPGVIEGGVVAVGPIAGGVVSGVA